MMSKKIIIAVSWFLLSMCLVAAEKVSDVGGENVIENVVALNENFISGLEISGDDWEEALLQINLKLKRDLAYNEKEDERVVKWLQEAYQQSHEYAHEVKFNYYRVLQYDVNDALKMMLYCEKISLAMHDLRRLITRFSGIQRILQWHLEFLARLTDPQYALQPENIAPPLQPIAVENNELTAKEVAVISKWHTQISTLLTHLQTLNQQLTKLDDASKLRQNEAVKIIFFDNEENILSALPSLYDELIYWLDDVDDVIYWQRENFLKHRNTLATYFALYFGGLLLLVFAFYRGYLRKIIHTDLPDIFAARHKFRNSFLGLLFGAAIYLGAKSIDTLSTVIGQQLASWLMLAMILRIALLWRLSPPEYQKVAPLYRTMIATYFCAMLLNIVATPYSTLVPLMFFLGLFATIIGAIIMRRYAQMPPIDRIYGVLTTMIYATATILAGIGFAFLALSLVLAWAFVVPILHAIAGFGNFIQRLREVDRGHHLLHEILQKIFLPAAWIGMLIYLTNWLTHTFHLTERFNEMLKYAIVWEQIAQFTVDDIWFVLMVGLAIYFALHSLRALLRGFCGEFFTFGLLPSFVILGSYITWAIYGVFALTMFNVQYSSILVVLGGMSVGLGFGLKDIVENFIAGLILLVGQQLRPGDIVEVVSENIYGKVVNISVRSTVVEMGDGARRIYPNTQVLTKDFRNWTSNNLQRRVSMIIGVSYAGNLPQILAVIMQTIKSTDGVLAKPEPKVLYRDFNSSAIDLELRFWTNITNFTTVQSELRRRLYAEFLAHNIAFPSPQLEVHLKQALG